MVFATHTPSLRTRAALPLCFLVCICSHLRNYYLFRAIRSAKRAGCFGPFWSRCYLFSRTNYSPFSSLSLSVTRFILLSSIISSLSFGICELAVLLAVWSVPLFPFVPAVRLQFQAIRFWWIPPCGSLQTNWNVLVARNHIECTAKCTAANRLCADGHRCARG